MRAPHIACTPNNSGGTYGLPLWGSRFGLMRAGLSGLGAVGGQARNRPAHPWAQLSALRPRLSVLILLFGVLVLAGDFNSTLNQGPMRELTSEGCTDVGRAAGTGASSTWPSFPPDFLGITIAHVLVAGDEVRVADYRTVGISGTDHSGLITEVCLRRLNCSARRGARPSTRDRARH
ncbi:endonuclease/exonuclease/phosphatase family protein [Actinopolyspora halophila]|uniref:endonuclease/exonuclease/phosphatase family protein n=1 Tax=Actinopolyspora halophila TaxID=1850 RepID=UPI00037CDDC7|nr:endonuclease/exonuclease/phosphatase family protein [Actinopolyspora halophila]